jgi:uncharacterized protein (TIGR02588 family)
MTKDERTRTSTLEWIAAAVGLALLLAVLGVIGRQAVLGQSSQPPAITVAPSTIVALRNGYLVEFDAFNQASGTAAAVTIEGVLKDDAGSETAMATLDYVAGQGSTQGGLFFTRDPRRGQLRLRALGYQHP